jgi:hypothetical protein
MYARHGVQLWLHFILLLSPLCVDLCMAVGTDQHALLGFFSTTLETVHPVAQPAILLRRITVVKLKGLYVAVIPAALTSATRFLNKDPLNLLATSRDRTRVTLRTNPS